MQLSRRQFREKEREEALVLEDYRITGPVNPINGSPTPREFKPAHFKLYEEEWPEAAAATPSIFDTATRKNRFHEKLRIALRTDDDLVGSLIHIEGLALDEQRHRDHHIPGIAMLDRMHWEHDLRRILDIDVDEQFGKQDLSDVLKDLRSGFPFSIPDSFEPTPFVQDLTPEAQAICEATRKGAWLLYHYLGAPIEVDEKAAAGDFFSELDLASDLSSIYSLREHFKGRIATATLLDKKTGATIAPDDTAENIRARGQSPVFIVAEESSPELDMDVMQVGDTVIFDDGMDGSSAAKFQIPGGASVMVGIGKVSLTNDGEKYVDLQASSILFAGSKSRGTGSEWYFAQKGMGSYVRRSNGSVEKLDMRDCKVGVKDAHIVVNRYGDERYESPDVRCLQEKSRQPGNDWPIPSAITVGLPSSEHGLRVVDPNRGMHVAVSDNGESKTKVGWWDLVTMLHVREAGGVVQDFEGTDVQIPSPNRPMIFTRSPQLALEVRQLVRGAH